MYPDVCAAVVFISTQSLSWPGELHNSTIEKRNTSKEVMNLVQS